jgi:hypothetical protein
MAAELSLGLSVQVFCLRGAFAVRRMDDRAADAQCANDGVDRLRRRSRASAIRDGIEHD